MSQPARALRKSFARGGARNSSRGSWKRGNHISSSQPHSGEASSSVNSEGSNNRSRPRQRRGGGGNRHSKSSNIRPTHFLSLPLGAQADLAQKVQAFTNELLVADPPISGLEKSVIIPPAYLHITLGVMHLKKNRVEPSDPATNQDLEGESVAAQEGEMPEFKTIQEAIELLESIRDKISNELKQSDKNGGDGDGKLRIPLNAMGVLQTEKNKMAHVLWFGPKKSTVPTTLDRVAGLVNDAFRTHDFITEKRPLKLHCTIINTLKRKGAYKNRIPFSHEGIFSSQAYTNRISQKAPSQLQGEMPKGETETTRTITQVVQPSQDPIGEDSGIKEHPIRLEQPNFGTYIVDEIQLCEMGSHDPVSGGYVAVGRIKL